VVVVAALRRAFGIAARPGGHVDGEDQRVSGRQVADQQVAQPIGVDAASGQGGVGAAPAAPGEAGMQLRPEQAEPRKGEAGINMAAQPDRTEHRQAS
jgi:hypothetical protein